MGIHEPRHTSCLFLVGLHCQLPIARWGRRRATRSWIGLSTVGTSDPPASRSDTRTVEGARARMQSGVPTKQADQ